MANLKRQLTTLISPGVHHETSSPVVEVSNLAVHYHRKVALEAISFRLDHGERIAVVGPNGAGKSTLLKVIAGIIPPSSGHVNIYGHNPGEHICIAYVPQRSQVDWNFPVNVFDVVMMGRTSKIGLLRLPTAQDRALVYHCLEQVGIHHLAKRQIGELSGGQQQRVCIAQALAQEAQLMLMDEPLTGLDMTSQDDIFQILDNLRQYQVTVMISTHDLNQAAEHFDRMMLINCHMIGFGLSQEVLTMEHLLAAYGGHMRVVGERKDSTVMVDSCCDGGEIG